MPTITYGNQTITCNQGDNLRKVLLANKVALYNGNAKTINCHGFGSCGTCAVEIDGSISSQSWKEKTRLSLPPHNPDKKRRLACQVSVEGDITVKKYDGFWGQGDTIVNG
ncbi:2Fe-2S iron-sulfur cluster-binding protein [Picosynechococcus sp. NKBG15041c]|uniref:2Fe-2S iron-sulfur cluster-binding protein n=1 Tax=Picosynechococcus sp. NKBG15041c TaxID=1407650 RepID=UPI000401C8A1|nr:2Fe-2S iron-sulfur cluster-binding protein [Picosynechococcus sp. NKBG15041c]